MKSNILQSTICILLVAITIAIAPLSALADTYNPTQSIITISVDPIQGGSNIAEFNRSLNALAGWLISCVASTAIASAAAGAMGFASVAAMVAGGAPLAAVFLVLVASIGIGIGINYMYQQVTDPDFWSYFGGQFWQNVRQHVVVEGTLIKCSGTILKQLVNQIKEYFNPSDVATPLNKAIYEDFASTCYILNSTDNFSQWITDNGYYEYVIQPHVTEGGYDVVSRLISPTNTNWFTEGYINNYLEQEFEYFNYSDSENEGFFYVQYDLASDEQGNQHYDDRWYACCTDSGIDVKWKGSIMDAAGFAPIACPDTEELNLFSYIWSSFGGWHVYSVYNNLNIKINDLPVQWDQFNNTLRYWDNNTQTAYHYLLMDEEGNLLFPTSLAKWLYLFLYKDCPLYISNTSINDLRQHTKVSDLPANTGELLGNASGSVAGENDVTDYVPKLKPEGVSIDKSKDLITGITDQITDTTTGDIAIDVGAGVETFPDTNVDEGDDILTTPLTGFFDITGVQPIELETVDSTTGTITEITASPDVNFTTGFNLLKGSLLGVTDKFPFSIPSYLKRNVGVLSVEALDPVFEIPIHVESIHFDTVIPVDFTKVQYLRTITNWFLCIILVVALAFATKALLF